MTEDVWGAYDVTSQKGKNDENFPVGSFLIARRHRPAVYAYYNFARAADDMVDTTRLTVEQKKARLEGMAAVLRGESEAPRRADAQTAVTLRRILYDRAIPLDVGTDLITAFCMDADKGRYDSWDELLLYCRYSANPVGRFLLMLHGEDAQTLGPSDALCSALQILNHLQDVASDLCTLDRCYIPRPWLDDAGVTIEDIRCVRSKPGLRCVFDRMLDGVDILNRQARVLPGLIKNRRMRLEAGCIVNVSHRLAARLRRQDPVFQRVALTRWDAVGALAGTLRYVF